MNVILFNGARGSVDRDELEHAKHLLRGDACECEDVRPYNGKVPFRPEGGGESLLINPDDIVVSAGQGGIR